MSFVVSRIMDFVSWCSESETNELISDVVDQCKNQTVPCFFVGRCVWETMAPNNNLPTLLSILKQHNIKTILIFESTNERDPWIDQHIKPHCEHVLFIDFFAYRCYQELVVKQVTPCNPSWNPNANKFLYLTGTARCNRLQMFYKLVQAGLVDNMTWSLFLPADPKILKNECIPELSDMYDFFKSYEGSPDQMKSYIHSDGTKTVGEALKYDWQMYSSTRFRLIAETDAEVSKRPDYTFAPARATEKTWSTIANRVPFLILGPRRILKTLQARNIRTFEQYAPVPDYDSIIDLRLRMDSLVSCVEHWIKNPMPEDIHNDVEHNYQQFVNLGKSIDNQLETLIDDYQLDIVKSDLLPTIHNLYPL